MKKDIINWILVLLVVILSLIIIYQLILKITGHSPTDTVILYSLIGLVISSQFFLFHSLGDIKYQTGKTQSKLDSLANQFAALAHDFKQQLKRGKK